MKLKSSQKGFTLVEILVAIAVSGVLLSGLLAAIFQTTRVTARTTPQITALENIKNSAYWISKDVRMAATTNLVDGAGPVNNLVLDWTSWYDDNGQLSPVYRHCEYAPLSGGEVQRYYDPDTSVGGGEITTTVGRYISDIQFSRQGQIILVTITCSPEDKAETAEQKSYHMYLQPKEDPIQ